MNRSNIKIGVISLGCDKNRVDTEQMLGVLDKAGYSITPDEDQADVIIVNTCAFILPAREESINTILEAVRRKEDGKCRKLIVTGCLSEKYMQELRTGIPEADCFLGIRDYDTIDQTIDKLLENDFIVDKRDGESEIICGTRILTTPRHYAYLKIADGCDNFCTYCTIPSIRGRYRSYPQDKLVKEAETLVKNGSKELVLVAQDVTNYGADFKDGTNLCTLLRKLVLIPELEVVRLLYCYPERITDELIDLIATEPKIAHYLDIPMQHVSSALLKKMGRKSDGPSLIALMARLRERIPDISVRTTFIVGFPGETEEDVKEIEDFIRNEKMTNVGFFAYSLEEDTPSAKLPNRVPEEVTEKRLERVEKAQFDVCRENNAKKKGKTYRVVVDDSDMGEYTGRSFESAPDVDFVIRFSSDRPLDVGDYVNVLITGSEDYDLTGKAVFD